MPYAFITKLRVLLFLLTGVALLGYPFVPLKRLNLLTEDRIQVDVYSDASKGGSSKVEWLDRAGYNYRCFIDGPKSDNYCGISIKFHDGQYLPAGINLTGYSDIVINVNYKGDDKTLILFYRNADEQLHDFSSVPKQQYIYTFLDKGELGQTITVPLNSFILADWWLYQNYIQRSQIHRGIDNVVEIGLSTNGDASKTESVYTINQLFAVGLWVHKEDLYFSILILWLTFALLEGAFRVWSLWREKRRYALHLSEMEDNLRTLESDFKTLETTSSKDTLTGVYNRAGLYKALSRTTTFDKQQAYLYVLDIDHFKQVNDGYGHDVGDVILKDFAIKLVNNLRNTDLIARWGGEEFVIVAHHNTQDGAMIMAEKLRCVISDKPIDTAPKDINNSIALAITTSIGVTQILEGEEIDSAFKRADQALYLAKNKGRNRAILCPIPHHINERLS